MTGKLALAILAAGATACALLGARQARIQAAHELAASRFRQLELHRERERLGAMVASRTHPAALREVLGERAPGAVGVAGWQARGASEREGLRDAVGVAGAGLAEPSPPVAPASVTGAYGAYGGGVAPARVGDGGASGD